ncbi:copper chaperone PCu(A)C [Paracoccus aestuarii]|jgi:periplasmic copper chaperone A|uniref:Copper chaperone PCu(A)C n=1 Tax=Paracoccus aestuarii TaxID=453842 RepID=A0A418ZPQ4_9RHOB|nr:copper chaperone PCu(A)C [Paracoccus aestuarii]RJK94370.1 copper chaperone PCu(A)C [Paracoccus aestuarii]WCR01313.1 copper chaperone PCu(A)C [Paracoccus aestuarii]
MLKSTAAALVLATILPATAFAECVEVTQGNITVSAAWSRATIGTERPAVFYVTIRNDGGSDERLVGIETPVADMPMLHESVMENGAARMSHVDQIVIAPIDAVSLEPGGYHGMLMDLQTELVEGTTFPVTLLFEKSGPVTIDTAVLPLRAREAACEEAL